MYISDQANILRHAIARAFCVVGGWDSPINDDKLHDIDVALSRCSSFNGVNDSDRAAILADADAAIQRDGQDGLGDVNEVIGSEHGPEMVEVMIGLVLSWNANADKKKQLMWHIPPDMGLSLDDYYRMWDRIASGSQISRTPSISALPTAEDGIDNGPTPSLTSTLAASETQSPPPQKVTKKTAKVALDTLRSKSTPPSLPSKPPSGRIQNELRLLEQYEEEMRQLTDTLADADPQSSKHIQKKIEQKKAVR